MARELVEDFMQIAKDYAKAEKELEIQKWVFISVERENEKGERVRLFCYDLPRDVYDRRRWVVGWRKAKLVCQYPMDNVNAYFSFYDKRLGNNPKFSADLRTLISAKAQVTKVQRRIEEYITYNKANNLFFDESTDVDLLKIRDKLASKIANVQAAEERLKQKIREYSESRTKVKQHENTSYQTNNK